MQRDVYAGIATHDVRHPLHYELLFHPNAEVARCAADILGALPSDYDIDEFNLVVAPVLESFLFRVDEIAPAHSMSRHESLVLIHTRSLLLMHMTVHMLFVLRTVANVFLQNSASFWNGVCMVLRDLPSSIVDMAFSEVPLNSLVEVAFRNMSAYSPHFWQVASCVQILIDLLADRIWIFIEADECKSICRVLVDLFETSNNEQEQKACLVMLGTLLCALVAYEPGT
jgi:hypothetical protein